MKIVKSSEWLISENKAKEKLLDIEDAMIANGYENAVIESHLVEYTQAIREEERKRIVEAMKKLYRPHYRASATTSATCYSYSVPEGRPEENCTCGKTAYDYALSLVFAIVNGEGVL